MHFSPTLYRKYIFFMNFDISNSFMCSNVRGHSIIGSSVSNKSLETDKTLIRRLYKNSPEQFFTYYLNPVY